MPSTKTETMTVKSNNANNTDMVFTVPEIAKILKVNVDYVHKLRKAGLLKFMKLGKYKCRKVTLEKFLENYEGKDVTHPDNIHDLEGNG